MTLGGMDYDEKVSELSFFTHKHNNYDVSYFLQSKSILSEPCRVLIERRLKPMQIQRTFYRGRFRILETCLVSWVALPPMEANRDLQGRGEVAARREAGLEAR